MDQHLRQLNSKGLRKGLSRFLPFPRSSQKPFFYIPNAPSDQGSALIMAAIFMLVATFLITTGVKLISYASAQVRQREIFVAEAENVAKSGLIDALSWFRRQPGVTADGIVRVFPNSLYTEAVNTPTVFATNAATGSPFTYIDQAFNPIGNTSNVQFSDTIDQTIGIVSEYPLDSPITAEALLWGRYEVKKQGVGAFDPSAAHDVTGTRSSTGLVSGDGMIWTVVSTGYVYRRMDKTVNAFGNFNVAYNVSPNVIVARAQFSSEYKKLLLNMPTVNINSFSSGVYANSTTQVALANNESVITGGSISVTGTYPVISMTK